MLSVNGTVIGYIKSKKQSGGNNIKKPTSPRSRVTSYVSGRKPRKLVLEISVANELSTKAEALRAIIEAGETFIISSPDWPLCNQLTTITALVDDMQESPNPDAIDTGTITLTLTVLL